MKLTVELTVLERLRLLEILPAQGNILTVRLLDDLKRKLNFTASDLEKYQIQQFDNGTVRWNRDIDLKEPAKIELDTKEIEIIKTALESLNKTEKLTNEHITLWEKFIEGKKASQNEVKEVKQ